MAAFTITIPGSNEDMNELRRRLTELSVELGFGARRAASAGGGSMSGLLAPGGCVRERKGRG